MRVDAATYTFRMSEKKKMASKLPKLLEKAYPNLSPAEREEAGENLRRYLEVCVRIWEREQREKRSLWKDDIE